MTHNEFLAQLIDRGVAEVKLHYKRPDQADRLEGSIDGFEVCRDQNPAQLKELLEDAGKATHKARLRRDKHYWKYRCYELQIEWVCNCVSAAMQNQGLPVLVPPTARGYMQAARIVGVVGMTPRRPNVHFNEIRDQYQPHSGVFEKNVPVHVDLADQDAWWPWWHLFMAGVNWEEELNEAELELSDDELVFEISTDLLCEALADKLMLPRDGLPG